MDAGAAARAAAAGGGGGAAAATAAGAAGFKVAGSTGRSSKRRRAWTAFTSIASYTNMGTRGSRRMRDWSFALNLNPTCSRD